MTNWASAHVLRWVAQSVATSCRPIRTSFRSQGAYRARDVVHGRGCRHERARRSHRVPLSATQPCSGNRHHADINNLPAAGGPEHVPGGNRHCAETRVLQGPVLGTEHGQFLYQRSADRRGQFRLHHYNVGRLFVPGSAAPMAVMAGREDRPCVYQRLTRPVSMWTKSEAL